MAEVHYNGHDPIIALCARYGWWTREIRGRFLPREFLEVVVSREPWATKHTLRVPVRKEWLAPGPTYLEVLEVQLRMLS